MGYAPRARVEQRSVRHAVPAALAAAAERAGLDRSGWVEQGGADSVLAVLPEGDPADEARLVGPFAQALAGLLDAYNGRASAQEQVRLRMAVHRGLAERGPLGYHGPGPVLVSRLADSRPLRQALTASTASLALALSGEVFQATVPPLRAEDFRELRVRLAEREYAEPVWLWLPTGDVHALELPEAEPQLEPAEPAEPEPAPQAEAPAPQVDAPAPQVVNRFEGAVDARGAVFGIVQDRR
ncbi:hypothetical protein CFP65_3724 [Kitasatospora sp. MMS16-BH015]|uniref:hypothetical protein n=1 Tax=Kitasatospora sp. MMS16-BH015 TaxID=2018025 RepID=UPI000CA2441E|nr:hypothetical protein [Kitasatospora sp. MMS16-BH015]AUG78510.1 hypothetical protein CFP65_3724 [Kitasatospora sp. MMS16-BH015]